MIKETYPSRRNNKLSFVDSKVDPCSNYSLILYDPTRHADYYNDSISNEFECESPVWNNGWYRFDGSYTFATSPVFAGQCGSYNPIWINGKNKIPDKVMSTHI